MDILSLIIQLLSGAAGGNIIGTVMKNLSLGPIGNTIAGIIGGFLGGNFVGPMIGPGQAAAITQRGVWTFFCGEIRRRCFSR